MRIIAYNVSSIQLRKGVSNSVPVVDAFVLQFEQATNYERIYIGNGISHSISAVDPFPFIVRIYFAQVAVITQWSRVSHLRMSGVGVC